MWVRELEIEQRMCEKIDNVSIEKSLSPIVYELRWHSVWFSSAPLCVPKNKRRIRYEKSGCAREEEEVRIDKTSLL